MAQKKNGNQKIEEKSSKANKSIDDTFAEVEAALESTDDAEAAYESLVEAAEAEENTKSSGDASDNGEQPALKSKPKDDPEEDTEGMFEELPASYRKEVREMFNKIPDEYKDIKTAFIKRAHGIEKDRTKFYSEYQSKTAFANKIAGAINPYLDAYTARGIAPEAAIARAAKLDHLINTDAEGAVKFIMQMTGIASASLTTDEVKVIQDATKDLTGKKQLTQDEIRQIVREESTAVTSANSQYQSQLEIVKSLADKKTTAGKSLYPGLQDQEFCSQMKPALEAMLAAGTPYEKALMASYHANGGVIEAETVAPKKAMSDFSSRDAEKVNALKQASNIRPANSSTNSINLDDLQIPDSIEDTFALAQKMLAGS